MEQVWVLPAIPAVIFIIVAVLLDIAFTGAFVNARRPSAVVSTEETRP